MPVTARQSEVLVLGGGVIGLATALALLRSGRGVTVVERATIGSGASHGNCGTITPSLLPLPAPGTVARGLKWLLTPDAPLRVKPTLDPALLGWLLAFARRCNARDFRHAVAVKSQLLRASRARLAAWIAEEGLDCEFVESGHLTVYRDSRALAQAEASAALLREHGVDTEILDAATARMREPALNPSIAGAHFHPGDAHLRPDRFVAELARRVRERGGVIRERTEIRGFDVGDGRLQAVQCAHVEGNVAAHGADEFVYALGAWSPRLGRILGLRLPIAPGKGYSITYARPAIAPRLPMVLKERSVCVTSWPSGLRLGSTMEFAGYDATLNRTRLDALKRAAHEYLAEPPTTVVEEEWFGWRPMTSDDLPILGRAPNLANLVLATGHGMVGVSLAAITGEIVADLLAGRAPVVDVTAVAPTRFG